MKYSKYKKFVYAILALVIFAIGIVSGKGISFPYFEIDPKVNLLHLGTILNTLFIAIMISIVIDDKKKKDGAHKEIMVKRIDKLVEAIEELQKNVSIGKVGLQYAVSISKQLNQTTKYIWGAIGEHQIKTTVTKEIIIGSVREVRKLLTTTPSRESFTQSDSSQTKVSDDYIIYGPVVITQLMRHIELLKNDLFKAQIDIHSN